MRREIRDADRRAVVRAAARSWRQAGWITGTAEAEIATRFADDRQRLGPALRTLLFLLTWFAMASGFGTIIALLGALDEPRLLLLVAGVGCIALAEVAYGPLRMLEFGPESALAWGGIAMSLAGFSWLLFELLEPGEKVGLFVALAVSALILAIGAWRWGSWLMALVAGGAVLGILAGLPAGRVSWIAAGLVGTALWLRAADSDILGPAHRRCCAALMVLSIAAVAFAFFPESNDGNWIELIGLRWHDRSPVPPRLAWIGSIVLVLGLAVLSIRTRRRTLLIVAGVWGAALIAAVLQDVRPIWASLCGAGIALIGAALFIRRFLDSGAGGERAGFSSATLLDDSESRRLLESAAALATLAPAGRALPVENTESYRGQGGDFGGGGSSSSF